MIDDYLGGAIDGDASGVKTFPRRVIKTRTMYLAETEYTPGLRLPWELKAAEFAAQQPAAQTGKKPSRKRKCP